jgi:hypothetical protein
MEKENVTHTYTNTHTHTHTHTHTNRILFGYLKKMKLYNCSNMDRPTDHNVK